MDQILFTLLIFIFTLFISWILRHKFCTTYINLPPGPLKLPFIGNLHQLVGFMPHRRLADLAKTYGPLMHLQLGQVSTVIVSSPDVANQVLKANDINFCERGRAFATDIIFYNRKDIGYAPYGEYWRQIRKICMVELFGSKRVESFRFIREEEVSNCIRSINSKVGSEINITEMVSSLTNTIMARTAMGRKSKHQEAFLPLVDRVLKAIGGFSVAHFFPSLEFFNINGVKYRLQKLHKEFDEVLDNIIAEHRSVNGGQSKGGNFLDVLLNLCDDPEFPLATDSIKAVIMDIFTAGLESSSTTIEWAFSELMKNPRVMVKAQEEVRRVYIENGKIDETMIHELNFLRSVIKETIRLHPPATLIPRQCRERCKINGYDINVKTEVLINAWAIGRDPSYWIEAERFYPERFLDSPTDYKGLDFEFIPFGSGRRMCPGLLLGITNVELPLAHLLCHFDWKLPNQMKPEDLDMTEAFSAAVRRKTGLCLIPFPYHDPMLVE